MTALVLTLALLPRAEAFAPTESVYTGIEPHRIQHVHPQEQARLRRGDAWQRFVETDGEGWRVRFDEATGTPRWMVGTGIDIGPTDSADAVLTGVETLLLAHHALLGFEPGQLAPRSAHEVERTDTWYVELDVLRDGLPTYRGGISARVKHGKLVMLSVATAPSAPVTGARVVPAAAAIDAAIQQGPAAASAHTERRADAVLLERKSLQGMELRHAWQVRTRTADPPGIWVSFVDAATGELLHVYNEVRFLQGSVEALHHERTVDGSPLVQSPVPQAFVDGDVDSDLTDASGIFDVIASGTYSTDFAGDYLTVNNSGGSEGSLSSSSPDLLWTDADATQAEIDSYIFLHQVQEWGQQVAPEVGMTFVPTTSNVNIGDVCNAYYDGYSVNFFSAGGGCNNTGQIADVNYHEWGHGFHAWSLQAGFFDGSLSEGASDVVSFFLTDDPEIAPYFGNTGWAIRDVAPDQVYPQDYDNNPYAVHSNGLIFGGAMWDLWQILRADLGETAGTDTSEEIFAGILKGGPDIPGSYYEALVADDDDGNLGNGTPHNCQIIEAFALHGLGEAGDGSFFFGGHEPLVTEPALAPIDVTVQVQSSAPDCVDLAAAEATVNYRIDGGEWQSAVAPIAGDEIQGEIPAQPYGTFVEYYVDGLDTDGTPFAAPTGGITSPYSFFVGDVLEIACHDFEADDGGFTHELVSGVDQEGADDWQWGTPNGQSGDPVAAFSGDMVWGNDLGHDNYNGAYQADKVNRLLSPRYETDHYEGVFLQYRRWLNVEDGFYDQAFITANDEIVWANWTTTQQVGDDHHQEDQWVAHSVDLGGRGDRGSVRVGWEIHSDGGLEFGGWTLDDVCIFAPATPDNRLGITDFTVTQGTGQVEFTWTNPIHAPVEEVVIMRNFGAYSTTAGDGETIYEDQAPVAGEAMTFTLADEHDSGGFFAVYAFDGTDWLSWTIEDWNAGQLDGNGPPPGWEPDPTETTGTTPDDRLSEDGKPGLEGRGGCGCDAAGSTTAAGWLSVGLLGLLARRRR